MSLVAGTRIGPYEILASLGAGGMGEVYRARDPRLERAVAVKILTSARGATAAELERFQREARAIARLSHPHICTVHDVGQQDGVAFLVMELLEGETLAERLERGAVPLDRAHVIAVQIAEALDAAHGKGVIHRDLKPSNVMLTASGVKLLDFGLAKLRDHEYEDSPNRPTKSLQLTDQGTVLGTLPYMAPEQVEGREADARTDIFALGVVLYEMTTRCAPFQGNSRASLTAAILTHDPPPVSSLVAAAPASLDRIVKKCLTKDPDERWQSARDLASALQWSKDDETAQHVASRSIDGRRRRNRTWLVAALAVGAALAVHGGLGARRNQCAGAGPGASGRVSTGDVPARRRVVRAIHARRPELRLQRELGGPAVRRVPRSARKAPTPAISGCRRGGSSRSPAPATWPCSSLPRTSSDRSECGRWRACRWQADRAAICSMGSSTRIGYPEQTVSPLFEIPAATVRGPSSFPLETRFMKLAPRGRFASRLMGVAWPSSRDRRCSTIHPRRW